MGNSTLITDYMGQGTAAARPAAGVLAALLPSNATALYSETDTGNVFALVNGGWVQVNGGGGGGGGSRPVIRGSALQVLAANSYTMNWPAGTVAGDVAFVFAMQAYSINDIPGWAVLDNEIGSNVNGAVFAKELSAADITAGSVTVTMTGFYDGAVGLVITVTQPGDVRQILALRESSGQASVPLESIWSGQPTDLILLFGATRENVVPTVTGGTTLQSNDDGANAGAVLAYANPASAGGNAFSFNYTSAGDGDYSVVLVLKALGT